MPIKYLLITRKKSNPTVENPGRHHLNQVTKVSLIDKGTNAKPAAPEHLLGDHEQNVASPL